MAAPTRVKRTKVAPASAVSSELSDTMKEIQKRYGGNVMSSGSSIVQPLRIPTGIFTVDMCTLGGIPSNRCSMVVGERHAGKSVFAAKCTRGAQMTLPDQKVAYLDIEGTFDSVWAGKLGVNLDDLLVVQPETGESAVDIADALVGTQDVSMIVLDSIAALTPMKELEGSAEDALVGVQARLVGNMIRKVTAGLIRERNRGHYVTVLFVNQFRTKIGGFSPQGEPRSIPGGKALEFSTSLQLIMRNKETAGKDKAGIDSMVENEHAFTVTKNKLNGGLRTGEFRLLRKDKEEYGLHEGDIDDLGTMLLFAKKFGAYEGGGSSWTLHFWDEEHKFRGVDDACATIYADEELRWKLRNYLIWEQASNQNMPASFLARFTDPYGIEIE